MKVDFSKFVYDSNYKSNVFIKSAPPNLFIRLLNPLSKLQPFFSKTAFTKTIGRDLAYNCMRFTSLLVPILLLTCSGSLVLSSWKYFRYRSCRQVAEFRWFAKLNKFICFALFTPELIGYFYFYSIITIFGAKRFFGGSAIERSLKSADRTLT